MTKKVEAAAPPPAEAQPEPNWCRTCGRRPHDPVAALCPDTHHRKASPPSAPVGVECVIAEMRAWVRAAEVADAGPYPQAWRTVVVQEFIAKLEAALAQQPAAVDESMVERIAALLHEEATDEPWTVAGVEHEDPDRGYYRTLARKVIVRADQQPEAAGEMAELVGLLVEVRSHFTRDDDLPDDLLPRIDAALAAQQGGEVHELRLCESSRLFLRPDRLYRFTVDPDCSMCREAASYYAQPGGSDNDR